MPDPRKKYDSTVARIAGNIASGLVKNQGIYDERAVAEEAVQLARLIIAEVERTEIPKENGTSPQGQHH